VIQNHRAAQVHHGIISILLVDEVSNANSTVVKPSELGKRNVSVRTK
jgi:hypothetical protein